MKKKFLVLSAMLTLVVSGVCLQSCSSEFDSYTTEEYGYYTEEEINAIKVMATTYGLSIELNEDYYGPKQTLRELENEMIGLSALIGKHEMISSKKYDGKVVFTSKRDGKITSRSATRYIESDGEYNGSKESGNFNINVTISWKGNGSASGERVSGNAKVTSKEGASNSDRGITYPLTTLAIGDGGIVFNGQAKYYKYQGIVPVQDETKVVNKKHFIIYAFEITNGEVNTRLSFGTFDVRPYDPQNHYEEI